MRPAGRFSSAGLFISGRANLRVCISGLRNSGLCPIHSLGFFERMGKAGKQCKITALSGRKTMNPQDVAVFYFAPSRAE
jgi:hypothetical protein